MIATHATTSNGRIHSDVSDDVMPIPDFLHRVLGNLDGTERYARSLWRLPEGKGLFEISGGWPYEYMQSAGSAVGMTVEVRRIESDGRAVLYAVGHPVVEGTVPRTVPIVWNGNTLTVPENEVFEAEEAGGVYWYYYQHDTIPEGYILRELESWPAE